MRRSARMGGAFLAAAVALFGTPLPANTQSQAAAPGTLASGEATYRAHCAACHDHPDQSRALAKDVLGQMRPDIIDYALTDGKMKPMGAGLKPADRSALIAYLTGKQKEEVTVDWALQMRCPGDRKSVDLSGLAPVTTFGFDQHNTRTLTSKLAGLSKADLS